MTSLMKQILVVAAASASLGSASSTCASFGTNAIMQGDCTDISSQSRAWPIVANFSGRVSWACELPSTSAGPSFALCDADAGVLRFWFGGNHFQEVSLAPFTSPSGAMYFRGKVYVACYGQGPDPRGTSGVAVVDPATFKVEARYDFDNDGGVSHLHNVYAFDINGTTEIFAATIGNPWAHPPVAGYGLMRLDMTTGKFDDTYTTERLGVRSAVQQTDGAIFVLTQEPPGKATKLARLEPKNGKFLVAAETTLPPRSKGAGGADVFLGTELNSLFASDRGAGPNGLGMVYYYTYGDGAFEMHSGHETGNNPRYTSMLGNGDVVSCNEDDGTIKVFRKLGLNPTAPQIHESSFPAMQTVSFIIESDKLTPTFEAIV